MKLYTDQVSRIIQHAGHIAGQLGKAEIDTEHLLWGIAKECSGVSGQIFMVAGIDLRRILLLVEKTGGPPCNSARPRQESAAAQSCLAAARCFAELEEEEKVNDWHLLLSLLMDSDHNSAAIMGELGLTLPFVHNFLRGELPMSVLTAARRRIQIRRVMHRRDAQTAMRYVTRQRAAEKAIDARPHVVEVPRDLFDEMNRQIHLLHRLLVSIRSEIGPLNRNG